MSTLAMKYSFTASLGTLSMVIYSPVVEVEVGGGLQGTTTVCAQPGLHYRSKSTGGGAAGVTDLTFVCIWRGGWLPFHGEKEKLKGVVSEAAVMTSMYTFCMRHN